MGAEMVKLLAGTREEVPVAGVSLPSDHDGAGAASHTLLAMSSNAR
jgi:hypothetical protein